MDSNIFLDSDVILDFLLKREPFNVQARSIFGLAYNGEIQIFLSSLTVANIHYILRKSFGNDGALKKISELVSFCKILPVSEKEIFAAMKSGFSGFEDAIQHFSAVQNPKIKGFITRNLADYKKSQIPIFTPEAFLATIK
jgi:predicted nucleic acid-binding protein